MPTAHCQDCELTFRADSKITLISKVSQHESHTTHTVDVPRSFSAGGDDGDN